MIEACEVRSWNSRKAASSAAASPEVSRTTADSGSAASNVIAASPSRGSGNTWFASGWTRGEATCPGAAGANDGRMTRIRIWVAMAGYDRLCLPRRSRSRRSQFRAPGCGGRGIRPIAHHHASLMPVPPNPHRQAPPLPPPPPPKPPHRIPAPARGAAAAHHAGTVSCSGTCLGCGGAGRAKRLSGDIHLLPPVRRGTRKCSPAHENRMLGAAQAR